MSGQILFFTSANLVRCAYAVIALSASKIATLLTAETQLFCQLGEALEALLVFLVLPVLLVGLKMSQTEADGGRGFALDRTGRLSQCDLQISTYLSLPMMDSTRNKQSIHGSIVKHQS